MSAPDDQVYRAFVILTKPTDPTSIFTTDLGEGRIGMCVFSRPHNALLFGKNAQGIDPSGVSQLDAEALRRGVETCKQKGATHVLLDPSFGAGGAEAIEIDEFLSTIDD